MTVTLSFVFYLCGGGGGFGITTRWPSSPFPSFEMASGREATHFQELITEKSTPSSPFPTNRSFMDFLRASLSVRAVGPVFPAKKRKRNSALGGKGKKTGRRGSCLFPGGPMSSCGVRAKVDHRIERNRPRPDSYIYFTLGKGFSFPFFLGYLAPLSGMLGGRGKPKSTAHAKTCAKMSRKKPGGLPYKSVLPHTAGIGNAKSEAFFLCYQTDGNMHDPPPSRLDLSSPSPPVTVASFILFSLHLLFSLPLILFYPIGRKRTERRRSCISSPKIFQDFSSSDRGVDEVEEGPRVFFAPLTSCRPWDRTRRVLRKYGLFHILPFINKPRGNLSANVFTVQIFSRILNVLCMQGAIFLHCRE